MFWDPFKKDLREQIYSSLWFTTIILRYIVILKAACWSELLWGTCKLQTLKAYPLGSFLKEHGWELCVFKVLPVIQIDNFGIFLF